MTLTVAVIVWMLGNESWISDRIAISRSTDSALLGDPSLGASLPLPSVDYRGRSLPTSLGSALVVVGGSCTDCSLRSVDPASIDATKYDQVVFLYDSTAKDVPTRFDKLPANVWVCPDLGQRVATRFNPVWTPRFYLLNSHQLVSLQQIRHEDPAFLQRIK